MAKKPPPKKQAKTPKTKKSPLENLRDAIEGADKATARGLDDDRVLGLVTRVTSTRSIAVDKISRKGGMPHGRVVEFSGLNGCGKTTLVLQIIAEVQAQGGVAAIHDSEAKLDRTYARRLGVKTDDLLMIEPKSRSLESLIAATHRVLLRWIEEKLMGTPLVLVWDSVAASSTAAELEEPDTKAPGQAAKVIKQAMRVLVSDLAAAGGLLVITNQLYEKIGGFGGFGQGPKRSTFGGEGLRYHATQRYELIRIGTLKDKADNPVGIEVLVKATKNHVSDAQDSPLAHLEHLEEKMVVQRGFGTNNAWSIFERLKADGYIVHEGKGWKFQIKGGKASPPWMDGWAGLTDLLGKDPALFREMAAVYMRLP